METPHPLLLPNMDMPYAGMTLTPALSPINAVIWRCGKSAPPPEPITWHATARVRLTGFTFPLASYPGFYHRLQYEKRRKPGNEATFHLGYGCLCTLKIPPIFELLNNCKLDCMFCVLCTLMSDNTY